MKGVNDDLAALYKTDGSGARHHHAFPELLEVIARARRRRLARLAENCPKLVGVRNDPDLFDWIQAKGDISVRSISKPCGEVKLMWSAFLILLDKKVSDPKTPGTLRI